jgi:helix-hairpin-helix protein
VSQINTFTATRPYARLGANHGYVIDGDVARLHAEVELLDTPALAGNWALQLWACDQPHTSGPLVGVKIAEAALNGSLDSNERARRLAAEAQAHVPGGQRDYAMVLVLASGDAGHFTQVHDFANYPARQQFVTPHLDGRVGYRINGDDVVLEAERIRNPRASDNISGSLSMELWALADPYRGGIVEGHVLGRVDLGRLAGQTSLDAVVERVPFSPPPAGNWEIVLMLREWAGPAGYVTRDFARFAVDYTVSEPTPVREPKIAAATPQPREDSTAVRVPVVVDRRPARLAVNRATVVELAAIKGLSRKVATEIVKGRPYKSLDALISVRGIGPKLLDKLRADLTLN